MSSGLRCPRGLCGHVSVLGLVLILLAVSPPGRAGNANSVDISPPVPGSTKPPHFESTPCWFDAPKDQPTECAWFYPGDFVLEQPVKLPVVKIIGTAKHTGPMLYIPGGPGYAAGLDAKGMRQWWHFYAHSGWTQTLWLFDPRGTGLAEPAISCPVLRNQEQAGLQRALSTLDELRFHAREALACYRQLGGESVLEKFNSRHQVEDIKALIKATEINNWNLWAVSHGTRLALQVVRDSPPAVRSAVLDSTYPPGVNGILTKPAQLGVALDNIVAVCQAQPACDFSGPQLRGTIQALLHQARDAPWRLQLPASATHPALSFVVTDLRLLWMLFLASYQSPASTGLVDRLARAQAGEREALLPLAERLVATLLDPTFSVAVYSSVSCAQDWPQASRKAFTAALAPYPELAPYLFPDWEYSACRFWRSGSVPQAYSRAVTTAIPVLFLAGEYDAVTPPQWGRDAAANMPNAHIMEFAGASHGLTFAEGCAREAVARFVAAPDSWQRPECVPAE